MPEVVERKFKGDKVKFEILRDRKPMTLRIELDTVWPYQMQSHHYDTRLRYVVYGGLIFQPLSLDLLDAYQTADLRIRHYFDYFILEQIYLQHPDVIVLTNILPDPTNTYLAAYRSSIVDEVNGKKMAGHRDEREPSAPYSRQKQSGHPVDGRREQQGYRRSAHCGAGGGDVRDQDLHHRCREAGRGARADRPRSARTSLRDPAGRDRRAAARGDRADHWRPPRGSPLSRFRARAGVRTGS